jgi:hypothetical protein
MKNKKLVLLGLSLAILLVVVSISLASAAIGRQNVITCGNTPYPGSSTLMYPYPYPLCQFLPLVSR